MSSGVPETVEDAGAVPWSQLQNLRSFIAVAEADSLSAAARALNRAASAVARSVGQLEEALHATLLERTASGVLLTEAGRIVEARARRISDEIHAAATVYAESGDRHRPSLSSMAYVLFNGRKLQVIVELAASGSIARAADALDVSQSGVSMALSRTEEIIGEPLFARGRQRLEPTRRTLILLQHARRVAAEMRHMTAELASSAHGVSGTVIVGLLSAARTSLFPDAVTQVLAAHPRVRVKVLEWSFEHLVEGLRSGDVDFTLGVTREASEHSGLAVEPILDDALSILVRAGHPLLAGGRHRLGDLLDRGWILPRPQSRAWTLIAESFADDGLAPPPASVETTDLQIIRQSLLSSDMLAIASTRQLGVELASGQLRELPLRLAAGVREIALIRREGAMLSPAANRLMQAIRDRARSLAAPD